MQAHQVAGKSHDIVDTSLGREVVSEGQPCPSLAIADPPHATNSLAKPEGAAPESRSDDPCDQNGCSDQMGSESPSSQNKMRNSMEPW